MFKDKNHTNETRKRMIVRVISWRIGGIILAVGLVWWATGDAWKGLDVGILYNVIRVATHWGHEILWSRSRWQLKQDSKP